MYKPNTQKIYQEKTLAHKITPYDILRDILIQAPSEIYGKLETKLKEIYNQGKYNLKQGYNNVSEFLNDYLIMYMGHGGSKPINKDKKRKKSNWVDKKKPKKKTKSLYKGKKT